MLKISRLIFGALRPRLLLAAGIVLLIALAVACGDDGGEDGAASGTPTATPAGYLGMVLEEPLPKPGFTLTDTSGKPFDFKKETEGYLTYLYFGYTYCPDICPSHMADIAAVLKREDLRENVKVVFVTVDPDRDTPERLRSWLDLFDKDFVGLRGDSAALEAAMKESLGPLWFPIERQDRPNGDYLLSHAAFVILYTEDDTSHIVYPFGIPQAGYEHDLMKLIKEGWNPS